MREKSLERENEAARESDGERSPIPAGGAASESRAMRAWRRYASLERGKLAIVNFCDHYNPMS